MAIDRRTFLKMSGTGLLTYKVAGISMMLTPAQARSQGLSYQVLEPDEVENLELLGDALLPGAKKAGIAHFIDYQLKGSLRDTKLTVRFLSEVMPPYSQFYRQGLSALERVSLEKFKSTFKGLDSAKRRALIKAMASGEIENWEGPSASLFYFAVRADAVDVVYGMEEGFETLGVPYMAHLNPTKKW